MSGNNETLMAKAQMELEGALKFEKHRLCKAIGLQLVEDDERVTMPTGARGHIPGLPGTLFVNCNRAGEPCILTGHGVNGLAHYFWIPAVYRDGDIERSYALALCREDVDVTTGNVHTDFTRLQMARLTHDGPEIGGQANPAPERIERGWCISYLADESFPRAARCCGGRTVDTDDRPWGYEGFEGAIPTLDMTDPAYDPEAVAAFFLALIVHDVRDGLEH